jgi:hypothetical protein
MMSPKFFLVACAWGLITVPVEASNLNTQSNLIDEGIDAPAAAEDSDPQTVLDDIPLMQGLQKAEDKDILRILPEGGASNQAVAVGVVDVDDVYNFYKRALPAQGWQTLGARDYWRGNVTLHINAQADGKLSTVTYTETGEP